MIFQNGNFGEKLPGDLKMMGLIREHRYSTELRVQTEQREDRSDPPFPPNTSHTKLTTFPLTLLYHTF